MVSGGMFTLRRVAAEMEQTLRRKRTTLTAMGLVRYLDWFCTEKRKREREMTWSVYEMHEDAAIKYWGVREG